MFLQAESQTFRMVVAVAMLFFRRTSENQPMTSDRIERERYGAPFSRPFCIFVLRKMLESSLGGRRYFNDAEPGERYLRKSKSKNVLEIVGELGHEGVRPVRMSPLCGRQGPYGWWRHNGLPGNWNLRRDNRPHLPLRTCLKVSFLSLKKVRFFKDCSIPKVSCLILTPQQQRAIDEKKKSGKIATLRLTSGFLRKCLMCCGESTFILSAMMVPPWVLPVNCGQL